MPDSSNYIARMKAAIGQMQLEGRLPVVPEGDFREHARCADIAENIDALLADLESVESEEVSKKVTRRRRKQTAKDAAVREFLRERAKGGASESSCSLVRETLSPSSPSLPTTKAKWPLWRDAGDKIKAPYYQLALEAMGSSYLFHLRLSNELMALAYSDPQAFTDYLRRRVALNLKRSLGRKVDFWFVIEADRGRFPHLHGALWIQAGELKAARKALYTAAGFTGKGSFAKYALRIVKLTNGIGAAGYATKSLFRTRFRFGGKCFTATNPVKKAAQAIYGWDRRARHREHPASSPPI